MFFDLPNLISLKFQKFSSQIMSNDEDQQRQGTEGFQQLLLGTFELLSELPAQFIHPRPFLADILY